VSKDDPLEVKLQAQAMDLERIIEEAATLRAKVNSHLEQLRRMHIDHAPPLKERRRKPGWKPR
jgi:hypothetical protein